MPDFCGYLYRLGPFTQDNLAYNSFRNGRIDFSSGLAYTRSWSSWEQSSYQEYASPSSLQQPRANRTLEVCYLLKLPRLTIDAGAQISSAFGIAHMAVYCFLGLNSSLCAVIEDSTHALDTRRTLGQQDERCLLFELELQEHLALRFFIGSLRWWGISLDHLERLVYSKVRRSRCLFYRLVKYVLISGTVNADRGTAGFSATDS